MEGAPLGAMVRRKSRYYASVFWMLDLCSSRSATTTGCCCENRLDMDGSARDGCPFCEQPSEVARHDVMAPPLEKPMVHNGPVYAQASGTCASLDAQKTLGPVTTELCLSGPFLLASGVVGRNQPWRGPPLEASRWDPRRKNG